MRWRVCEAAISHLNEFGFHRTSIVKVAERAGVSQGALQHHFPTKNDLIAAIVEFLTGRSVKWFSRACIELAKSPDAFGAVVRRSWREQFRSDYFAALLEILIASRTDDELRERIAPGLARWRAAIDCEQSRLIPAMHRTAQELDAAHSMTRAILTGLLIHDGPLGDEAHMDFVIDRWIALASR